MTDQPTEATEATEAAEPVDLTRLSASAAITLYRVDGRGRVNLAGVVADGVEFYSAVQRADGTILLVPVLVSTTAVKRNASEDPLFS